MAKKTTKPAPKAKKATGAKATTPTIPMSDDERKAHALIREAQNSSTHTLTMMVWRATASTIRKYMKDGHGIGLSLSEAGNLAAEWLGPPVARHIPNPMRQ